MVRTPVRSRALRSSLPPLRPKHFSAVALAVAAALGGGQAWAQQPPQAFGSMVAMQNGMVKLPNGQMSKWTGANRPVIGTDTDGRPLMSIEQTEQKALLDWEKFELQTNEVLEFQQQRADWIAVNRVHSDSASRIDGEIRATGRVFILNDNGVLMGDDAKINTRQLVTGKGVSDVLVDGATTTIVQSKAKATLNWSNMSVEAGEALRFQQEKKDWVILNRSLTPNVTKLNGTIKADGGLIVTAPAGLSIDGKIEAQQVIVSSLDMPDHQFDSAEYGLNSFARDYNNRFDPTFTNTWKYFRDFGANPFFMLLEEAPDIVDENDPLRFNVTVGSKGTITAGTYGKVMLFGPNVTNKGTIHVQDEGQVVLAAGENIYIAGSNGPGQVDVRTGAWNPLDIMRVNIPFGPPPKTIPDQNWQYFYERMTGVRYDIGHTFTDAEMTALVGSFGSNNGKILDFLTNLQTERANAVGYRARNEGIIESLRGGRVDFRGNNLEQMGAVTMTSTALFRGSMSFWSIVQDYMDYSNGGTSGPAVRRNGNVVFGQGSLTQITPDLDSTDAIPLTEGKQSVGSIKINSGSVLLEQDSMIYMPSGSMKVLLDADNHVFDNNRGAGANQENEDGTRFLMERGATIDLSGWKSTVLPMGYHQVSGKLFAAQLKDSPLQRDGALYRKEIAVDRRYGTNLADWSSFDNLTEGTLAQFLTDGGTFQMDMPNDFIMKAGSVIDVSGGLVTYQDGYVYTSLLRRLDGSVIDIREADPDELYMGLANEWVKYDTKWGRQQSYYIPLMSSLQGKYETSYVQGGNGGLIEILAPDVVLQGTLRGAATVGRYQRANLPKGGKFLLNNAGESEGEYVSNNLLITAIEKALPDSFGLHDSLSGLHGELFGKEFEDDEQKRDQITQRTSDNATLASADFFNRSTMGEYEINQSGRVGDRDPDVNAFMPLDGVAAIVEKGAQLNLASGASLKLSVDERMQFLGSVRTEGGDVSLTAMSLEFGADSRIDTRGSWYSDYELDVPVRIGATPRVNGGKVTIAARGDITRSDDIKLVMPATMVIDTSGGAWVDRSGKLKAGKGGDLAIASTLSPTDELDLSALYHARAYGLGGNGAFSLTSGDAIQITDGEAIPPPPPPPDIDGDDDADDPDVDPDMDPDVDGNDEPSGPKRGPMVLAPSFFENSGFSKITLTAPHVSVNDGVEVHATSASLQLDIGSLQDGVPSAYFSPSGTDIYDVATPGYLAPERRSSALRKGMDIEIGAPVSIGKKSVFATEVGGSFKFNQGADIHGTVLAPAGAISINAGTVGNTSITVHENGKLLAPGVALITSRELGADGRVLLDGEVLAGGVISLSASKVDLKAGAVLDVSGTSAVLDLPRSEANGVVAREPVTVASNGGSISITGQNININDATYRAHAGGTGAKGGAFSLGWEGKYGPENGIGGGSPEDVYNGVAWLFNDGYFFDLDGNQVTSMFGIDLSRVDFAAWGLQYDFAPGFTIANKEEFVALLSDYGLTAYGPPPLLMIGDNLPPPDAGSSNPPLPQVDTGLKQILAEWAGYEFPAVIKTPPAVTRLSTKRIVDGGFASLGIGGSPGVLFVGNATLGGKKADGSYVLDSISLGGGRIMGQAGANVSLEANVVNLSQAGGIDPGIAGAYDQALAKIGVVPVSENTNISIAAGTLMQVSSADFYGFSNTTLSSQGDIRLVGGNGVQNQAPVGGIHSTGKLTFKSDQLYAATGRKFEIVSDDTIEILPQDAGTPLNGAPYEAAATLTLKAPRIVQGGTIRSPLGTINLEAIDDGTAGAGVVTLLPGSLTSASADGRVIPFGGTSSGDTWIDPFTGLELTTLPTKTVNITGDVLDMRAGATVDISGSGDLYAREFVPGIGGSTDWLTGYRDDSYKWVSAPGEIFAVLPGFQGDIAPIGVGGGAYSNTLDIGEKVYLSGGSGLAAGFYTLLPAEYAALPGAFRVTARHNKGNFDDMLLGQRKNLTDGSSIQAGYRYVPGSAEKDARTNGFLVMPGDTLRMRTQYVETRANTFFLSDSFLKKALRTNRPVGEIPRIPLDGGSVVLNAGSELNLGATLKSAAATGGRGGFADINSSKIAVVGANTDRSLYDGYLILDSDRLNSFGAESLLLGGVRKQGAVNVEIAVTGTNIVVDNAGSVLKGPELLFASGDSIKVESGSVLQTTGQISGSSGDLRVLPSIERVMDEGDPNDPSDDVLVNEALDQGAVLRLSSGEQVNILRDFAKVEAMEQLRATPGALAQVNAARAALGLPEIPDGGNLVIADGASLTSSRSLAMDATKDTLLNTGATLSAKEISAAASRVSIGDVPAGTSGLVFAGGSLGALANASDITLKSYSTIDFHGGATLRASEGLRLDSREIRAVNADGQTVTIAGKSLALTSTNGGTATATAGGANFVLEGDNVYFEGGDKSISGVSSVAVRAKERIVGRDEGTVYMPGSLSLDAGAITAESGSRLFFDAQGAVDIASNGNTALPTFETFGATLGVAGSTVTNRGRIALTGGIVNLRARDGDLTLAEGSSIDVTSSVTKIFDKTVGVGGGTVNLTSDREDVLIAQNAAVDVSGTAAGGDAGAVNISAGLGNANLAGSLKGDAQAGSRSGSFSLLSRDLADFGAFNATLDSGGFRQSRRFEINEGDVNVSGNVRVQELAVVANDGSINVTGAVETVGANGGRIQLSAAENVSLASGSKLLAHAGATNGSGGTVFLETVGLNGGVVNVGAGSLIDVSGTGEGGRTVRLRAPQVGNDVAIAPVAGTITGARSVIAEGFRVYDNVQTIDQNVINTVSADATNFMANAAAIGARLGSGVTVAPGIELRSLDDMELTTDWDLHNLRFANGGAGVLTLRARGDLKINANLSDGFDGASASAALLGGASWALNLTAGANTTSPDSLAVLPTGQLAAGKGSVIVGGTADTIEYFYDPAHGNEHKLYRLDANGRFIRDPNESNYHIGWIELERDLATGQYIDPLTGALIDKDLVTGDYADTNTYARRPLPWTYYDTGGGYDQERQDGSVGGAPQFASEFPLYQQWDNSTGYLVRTGTGSINVAAGKNVVLQERPSVIYTAGESAAPVADFYAPTGVAYSDNGGDLSIRAAGDVLASENTPQMPAGWLARRSGLDFISGFFAPAADRAYDQTTWYVQFSTFEAGVGALGGGNVDISAGGDVRNLGVSIPNTGRVTGNTGPDDPTALFTTGGGNLSVRAGGNIAGGTYYVAEGRGDITAGGSFTAGSSFQASDNLLLCQSIEACYVHTDLRAIANHTYDVYPMLFTSSGDFRLQSGGDLNIDSVMDPLLYGSSVYSGNSLMSYTTDAQVSLFSAGGDVKIWNNGHNLNLVEKRSGVAPLHFLGNQDRTNQGFSEASYELWPANVSAVAATGDVQVLGGMLLAPSPTGNLDLLARDNVYIGYGTRVDDAYREDQQSRAQSQNYRSGRSGIFMSQAPEERLRTPLNPVTLGYGYFGAGAFEGAGLSNRSDSAFTAELPPDLHTGDTTPVRIYAGTGDLVSTSVLTFPKQLWVQAGNHIYFPYYNIQHNNLTDTSIVRAGNGLYFSGDGYVSVAGPGRLEVETGRDFWMPSNAKGITSNRIYIYDTDGVPMNQVLPPPAQWKGDQQAADIAISTGFNQSPDYSKFEQLYLDPTLAAAMEDYLKADAGDGRELPIYLFDRLYQRANKGTDGLFVSPELAQGFVNYVRGLQGLKSLETEVEQRDYLNTAWNYWLALPTAQATPFDAFIPRMTKAQAEKQNVRPQFYLPERREGLVNYVRHLQGLETLDTQEEQLAYLDTAWAYWATLTPDQKSPMFRSAFFSELRTTGREANNPDSDRANTTFRGYDAIQTLFPGAQKRADEALADGESRWTGDFETYAGRVISNGGGKVEFVSPGGALKLANSAALPGETGQPTGPFDRGNALRAGVVTVDGGEINVFAHDSVTLNESRILTTKGGNVMVWSSYGDIAAGKGAKTSISPKFYDYSLDTVVNMEREPAGLPTGAGIGTVASQPGSPEADVDLVAPNGIVDAGDAGIRVSGNFNVFAVQILGTDNIDVQGVSTGLPLPPAAPPTSLNVDDAAAKGARVIGALLESLKVVKENAAIKPPSIIEVKVLGYGEECAEDREDCEKSKDDEKSDDSSKFDDAGQTK